jgi:hypothetical protein
VASKSSAEGRAFTTGLDWSKADFSEEQRESISKWYRDTHGKGNLDLVRFIPFMLKNNPGALKDYRLWVENAAAGLKFDGGLIPPPAIAMAFLHYYVTLAYPEGVQYEIIAARYWGGTKAQIQELLAFAWLHGGPFGINTASRAIDEYMDDWPDDDVPSRQIRWPEGWVPEPELFRAGLDYSTPELSREEQARLEAWHVDWQGEVPPYVQFLGRNHPSGLKLYRRRYEGAIGGSLPKQLTPLLEMHLALMQGQPDSTRRAAVHAKRLGVTDAQLLQLASACTVYLGGNRLDIVADSLGELISS